MPVCFAGLTFTPGHYLYADPDGIVVADRDLLAWHARPKSAFRVEYDVETTKLARRPQNHTAPTIAGGPLSGDQ